MCSTPLSFHLRCRVPSGWHGLFCLAPIFPWSFCVDVCSPVCTVVGVLSAVFVECVSCVWQHVCASGQWVCLRLSGVRLLSHFKFMVACLSPSLPYPVVCRPRPHVLHVPERVVVGVCRPGLVVHLHVFFRCSSLCRFIVFYPVRRSVVFLHAVWFLCCVALDYPGFGGDCDFFWDRSGCNRSVCPRTLALC